MRFEPRIAHRSDVDTAKFQPKLFGSLGIVEIPNRVRQPVKINVCRSPDNRQFLSEEKMLNQHQTILRMIRRDGYLNKPSAIFSHEAHERTNRELRQDVNFGNFIAGTSAASICLTVMSDSTDYLMAHARKTIREARRLPPGPAKFWLRHIGSVYHLLAKQGAYTNIEFLEDYRAAKKIENDLRRLTSLVRFPN